MLTLIWILLTLVAMAGLIGLFLYNSYKNSVNLLVALDTRCDTAFADIDVHLKHRHNLIPGLVGVVKGSAAHEKDLLLGLSDAKSRAMAAMAPGIRLEAEG